MFRPPRDPVEAKRYYLTSLTIFGAVICLAGVAYLIDGDTTEGWSGVILGVAMIIVAEYFVRRTKR